jgi:hypothetical protein
MKEFVQLGLFHCLNHIKLDKLLLLSFKILFDHAHPADFARFQSVATNQVAILSTSRSKHVKNHGNKSVLTDLANSSTSTCACFFQKSAT